MKSIGSALAVAAALAIILITLAGLIYGVIEDPAVVGPLTAAAVAIGVAVFAGSTSCLPDENHRSRTPKIREQSRKTATALGIAEAVFAEFGDVRGDWDRRRAVAVPSEA